MSATQSITSDQLERFFQDVRPLLDSPSQDTCNEQSFASFFSGAKQVIDAAAIREREQNRLHAHRFNVMSWIEPDENKLSDLLAELLDPRGRHGQGDRFLRLLLDLLGMPSGGSLTELATIQREAPTHGIEKYRRRIDILIESSMIVAIENKIDSPDQKDQVKDYLDHLHYLSQGWTTPALLIYLTPNGRRPTSLSPTERREQKEKRRLHCWSYRGQLRAWLETCRAVCEADKIRHFISDFVAYIDSTLHRPDEVEDNEERL